MHIQSKLQISLQAYLLSVGTNIMLYISSSPHVLKDWIAIPNPRVNLVYKHCIRLKIYLVVKQLLYHSVSCYLPPIGPVPSLSQW